MTKTAIDRLGDRIKEGKASEEDLRMLDSYRRSFGDAYEQVIGGIRGKLGLSPTGRPTKSTTSISEKLRREHMRLSQMQDIAGCRLIVDSIIDQDAAVESLKPLFRQIKLIDRREHPSYGYRAIHCIVIIGDKCVEIQTRTLLQHLWAELSEKIADVFDPAIKYGGGKKEFCHMLSESSRLLADTELFDKQTEEALIATRKRLSDAQEQFNKTSAFHDGAQTQEQIAKINHVSLELKLLAKEIEKDASDVRQERSSARQEVIAQYKEMLDWLNKGRAHAFLN